MDVRETMLAGPEGPGEKCYEAGYRKACEDLYELDRKAPRRSFDLAVVPIAELRLPPRIYNCLRREGYEFIAQVLTLTDGQLEGIRNFRPEESIPELDRILESVGLRRAAAKR